MDPLAEFRKRLHAELVGHFTVAELTRLAEFELGVPLATVVFVQTAFDTVAFEFVGWCHRHGRLGDLVAACGRAKPAVLIFQHLGTEFGQLPPDATPSAAAFGRFTGRFTDQLRHLDFLQAYKRLHDILHDLDGELDTFQHEADARATAGTPVPAGTADYLQGKVGEAREWRAKTEHPPKHHWVDRFAVAVDEFLGADAARHDPAFRRLKNLPPQELEPLNSMLTDAARRVEVDRLGELLNWRLDGLPVLARAVSDFRRAGVRVRDLTAAHDDCQFIDREFRTAGERVAGPADLDAWADIRQGLDRIARLRPTDRNTARVTDAATAFERGTPGPMPPFADLCEKFAKLFEAVDKELLDAIQPLLTSALRLSNSLGNPQ